MRNKLFTILAIKALLYSLVFANPLDRLAIRAQIQKRWVLTETQLSYIATVTQTIPSGASNVGGISILQTVTIGNSAASAVTPDIIAPGLSNKQAVNVDSNNGNNNGDNNANNNGINNGNTAGQVTTANANNNNGNQAATPVPVPVASTVPAGPSSTAAANNNDNSNGDGDIVGNLNVKHAAANVQQGDAQTTPWPTAIGDGSNLISATFPVSSWPATASFTSLVLMHHNKHRQNSSVPSLSWNDEMANIAYTWASQCDYHHNTVVGGGGYGQNIAAGADPDSIGGVLSDLMYNGEINSYPGYGPTKDGNVDMTDFEKWGHYSQMVWKNTQSVGCAVVQCPNGLANTGTGVSPWMTVCNYSPPGNMGGEYATNVLQPGNQPSIDGKWTGS